MDNVSNEIAKVSLWSPSKRIAWFTTLIIVVLGLIVYFDRNHVIDILQGQINDEKADKQIIRAERDAAIRRADAADKKYNDLMEKTFRYNDSVAKDNRKFIDELKGMK